MAGYSLYRSDMLVQVSLLGEAGYVGAAGVFAIEEPGDVVQAQRHFKMGLTTYPWPVCLRMWRSKSDLRETEPSQMVQMN